MINRSISLHSPTGALHGQLDRPDDARGLILIVRAHHTPADHDFASTFIENKFATLTVELLSAQEIHFPDASHNVPRLSQRLLGVLDLVRSDSDMYDLALGIFANGDTAPAAIRNTAQRDQQVKTLVCYGGIIDHAGLQSLKLLASPFLYIHHQDEELASASYERSAVYLNNLHQAHTLSEFEHPQNVACDWFLRNLPRAP